MSVAMSPVISESCEYKQNVAESTVDAGNPPMQGTHLPSLKITLYIYRIRTIINRSLILTTLV